MFNLDSSSVEILIFLIWRVVPCARTNDWMYQVIGGLFGLGLIHVSLSTSMSYALSHYLYI